MLRIASIPATHAYVQRVLPALLDAPWPAVEASGTTPTTETVAARLPDPLPAGHRPGEGVWWPHAALDPAWIRAHRPEIDVVHLHFGFESRTAEELAAWVGCLDELRVPLVLTVHDLANPHLTDQAAHRAALDVLVPAASAVLTLTPGVAEEIVHRWGVEAQVLPHPQVVDDETLLRSDDVRATAGRRSGHPVVGLHLGALRANADPLPWLAELARACVAEGCRLDVVVNDEVEGSDVRRTALLAAVAETLADCPDAEVRVLPRMPDDELHRWVAGQEVAVLPYRHGTHSGWLEMCWDLGTSVLAPPVGHYAEQHAEPGFLATFAPGEVADALRSLLSARAEGYPWGDAEARLAARASEDARVRAAHEAAYAMAVEKVTR